MPTDCAFVVTSVHHLQENEKQSEKEKAKEKETEKESVDKSASAAARARKNRRPREKRRSTGVAYMPSEVGRAVFLLRNTQPNRHRLVIRRTFYRLVASCEPVKIMLNIVHNDYI